MTDRPEPDERGFLHLGGIANVRDLGGFSTAAGPTRRGRFLRAGGTTLATSADVEALRAYGVRYDVDLRGAYEKRAEPDPLAKARGIRYVSDTLLNANLHAPEIELEDDEATFLVRGYLRILQNAPAVRKLFRTFAAARADECVLFHCAAGMDRTGVASMLLLSAADAGRGEVVRDYAYGIAGAGLADAILTGAGPAAIAEGSDDWDEQYVRTVAKIVHDFGLLYDTLVARHGSVRDYLRECGVRERTLERAVRHLVG